MFPARRLLTVPAVVLALPLLVVSAPLWLVAAALIDAFSGLFRFPSVRIGLMAVVYLAHEWVCLAAAAIIVVRLWSTRPGDSTAAALPWRRVQGWWVASLVRWGGRLLGVHFDLPSPATLPAGGFVLLSRHASMADAVLPVYLLTRDPSRFLHYVLKRELRFDPTLDIYGHRLDNYFVSRDGDGDSEAGAIAALARRARPQANLVIFPEGTYATPGRRARIRDSLARRGETELVTLTDELRQLLPPKPAGTLAMLAGQPAWDVVVLGHAGLEDLAQLGQLRRRIPLARPVAVQWWHHDRATVPDHPEQAIAWLNEQWRNLDRWVDDELGHGPRSTGAPR